MDPKNLKAEDLEGKSLIDLLEETAVSESCKPGGMTYIRDAVFVVTKAIRTAGDSSRPDKERQEALWGCGHALVKACAIYAAMTVEPNTREKFLDAIREEIGTLGPIADKMREKLRRSVN